MTISARIAAAAPADGAWPPSQRGGMRANRGFTLLELLTVMAIMFLLMGMAIASYLAMTRGSAMRGAQDNLHKFLTLARQHAMTYRSRTYVVFSQKDTAMGGTQSGYHIVAQEGVHRGPDNSVNLNVHSEIWEPDRLIGGVVFNLSDGSSATVTDNAANFLTGNLAGGARNRWNTADRYGWMIHDAEYLPPTLMFVNASGNKALPETIVFLPDGTTEKKAGEYVVYVKEIRGERPVEFNISVQGLSGLIQRSDQF